MTEVFGHGKADETDWHSAASIGRALFGVGKLIDHPLGLGGGPTNKQRSSSICRAKSIAFAFTLPSHGRDGLHFSVL